MALVQAGLGRPQQQLQPNGLMPPLSGFGTVGAGVSVGPDGAQHAQQRQEVASLLADLMPGGWRGRSAGAAADGGSGGDIDDGVEQEEEEVDVGEEWRGGGRGGGEREVWGRGDEDHDGVVDGC